MAVPIAPSPIWILQKFQHMGFQTGQPRSVQLQYPDTTHPSGGHTEGHTSSCRRICKNSTIWDKDGHKLFKGDLCSCDLEILRLELDLQDEAFFVIREFPGRGLEARAVDNIYRGLSSIVLHASYMIFKGETFFLDGDTVHPVLGNYFPIRANRPKVPENAFSMDEALRNFEVTRVLEV